MVRVYLRDKLPQWLINKNFENFEIKDSVKFIVGVFDGDGGIYYKRYPYRIYKEIKLVTTNIEEFKLLQTILNNLNLRYNKTSTYSNLVGKRSFVLKIVETNNYERFVSYIIKYSNHPEKKVKAFLYKHKISFGKFNSIITLKKIEMLSKVFNIKVKIKE